MDEEHRAALPSRLSPVPTELDAQPGSGRRLDRPDPEGTCRQSLLFPGLALAHADLHNHTLLSDGAGAPEELFRALRRAGLDIVAATDHTTVAGALHGLGPLRLPPRIGGLDQAGWRRWGDLAAEATEDDRFVAVRGFEWSHPLLGHVNVWGTARVTQPWRDPHLGMRGLWRWLLAAGGGPEGLASFNHPGGRGTGRFGGFLFEARLRDRLVGLEIFNQRDDYLFAGLSDGLRSPLLDCIDRGWRPGLLGVSDEHGADWGQPLGKGRTGLFVERLDWVSVRRALLARRSFATRERGLRLAVSAEGAAMGSTLPGGRRTIDLEVDCAWGAGDADRLISVQVLGPGRPGDALPNLLEEKRATLGALSADPLHLAVPSGGCSWICVRLSAPDLPPEPASPSEWTALGRSLAYASPFWIG